MRGVRVSRKVNRSMSSANRSDRDRNPMDAFYGGITEDDEHSQPRMRESVLVRGRSIASRYTLRERIARGGMATIWEADDARLGRVVAIKFLGQAYQGDPEYRIRFEAEARAAAQLRSPFVVQMYDYGSFEEVPFLVMERLVGEDLHARMTRERRLSPAGVAKIAHDAGRALEAAHAASIIHRDLKPQNLFIASESNGETVKLLDFGVAKHAGTAAVLTATGVMLGSPFYMSPEQVRCERDLDARTDLWSLGAILYRALTGVKAFDGDMTKVLSMITSERPRPPSLLCPDLGHAYDVFFDKVLATDRERRFATAGELIQSFCAISGG
jgi:serine/threonine protein kinase